jgi:hypothetical protein
MFNTNEIRRDRAHELFIDGSLFGTSSNLSGATQKLTSFYQLPIMIGWHELWFRGRGTLVAGDVLFTDEEPMGGDYLRGPFANAFYTHRIVSGSAEFRFSLVRDVYKLSVYHDFALFGAQDLARTVDRASWANALGVGFHALIIEAFQFDVYAGIGWAKGINLPLPPDAAGKVKTFDGGFVLSVKQAF